MRIELNMEQKQNQKLIMTQSLQQSIQILRYDNEELRNFLQDKSLENPLLKVNIMDDYETRPVRCLAQSTMNDKEAPDIHHLIDNSFSLNDSLLQQIHLNYQDTYIRKLLIFLAGNIDKNGYLDISIEEAQRETGAKHQEVKEALGLLQQLDPPGVGARNLQECLTIQAQRDSSSPAYTYEILKADFDLFIQRKWQQISEKYKIELREIQKIADYIKKYSFHPSSEYEDMRKNYIVPDIIVNVIDNNISISFNKSSSKVITFRQKYFNKLCKVEDKEVQKYLKEKKEEFEVLQKSVIQRGDTILRVATEIVNYQKEFFLDFNKPLKPLRLKTIAKNLNIHESTVSRAVNGKYLKTNSGIYELKSFFSNGLGQKDNSDNVSAVSVKIRIKEIVEAENKKKPLSDQKIANIIKNEGIVISRRAIAKYRDELNIPSSTERKRYD
ncbi:RNA polymerase sigma-54 factor [Niallia circulans]|uniref:RNA polymerase factor sigma-54 n=1 Tax=Niallia circulans TaxID=1397 RepID=UPI000BA556FC|nr:RNA polymerase factor sigma-54 [Niallia circulans]PAE12243.1 RNA polymerase sigma-54 factor [Niallia circulans]